MLRATVALVVSVGAACSVAPAAETLQAIAPGVRIAGTTVGGLTLQPATERVQSRLGRPIPIVFGGKTFAVAPSTFGVTTSLEHALALALEARAHSRIQLRLRFNRAAVDSYVAALAKTYYRPPTPARVVGANAHGPIIRPGKVGLAVEQNMLRTALEQQLAAGTRHPLVLPMSAVEPARSAAQFGPVILVNRETNTLRLYSTTKLVRTFRVATGQSIYPTPMGIFKIVQKEMNPWWYPPTYDAWAKGLKPVPPGPDNPLGTRWMGLSVPGVGIHGTDEPTSIGYSESHGCIRMQVPDAEWLFTHVTVGTPVVIN